MKILFVSGEATPFCKTGGLGDVAGALPRALAKSGADVRVVVPLYDAVDDRWRNQMTFLLHINVRLSWRNQYCGVFELKRDGVTYYFIDNRYYFARHDLYGHFDDGERFAFFSKACLDILPLISFSPDVIHANDWQCALIPIYLSLFYRYNDWYKNIRTVFTIHNIEYQGRFSRHFLGDVAGIDDEYFRNGLLGYDDGICLMKGAIHCADMVTTVSETYAREICTPFYGFGLNSVLSERGERLMGIVNGIDTDIFNPQTDEHLFCQYGSGDLSGKVQNKLELQKLFGLWEHPDTPVIAVISRLVGHKGMDLFYPIYDELLQEDVNLLVLGKGEWKYEQLFLHMREKYPKKCAVNIAFSADLANKIYAGADMFLMPSLSEPCGLSQMIAMRYGTVPIVRETGGLRDTVSPYNEHTGEGLGFTFANYNAHEMLGTIRYALSVYRNKDAWTTLMKRGMESDFSWSNSAAKYMAAYESVCGE